jgi:hypothetical protein
VECSRHGDSIIGKRFKSIEINGVIKEATRLTERTQELETETKEIDSIKEVSRPEEKTADVSPARIERMKKAFRPTWLHDQINSNGNGKGKKE